MAMNDSLLSKEKSPSEIECPEIIGVSDAIKSVKEKIKRLSDKNVTVLIRGESGTGKELVARNIHCNSRRKEENFVHVNCAALPSELLESELFGYRRGAFTGATYNKLGRFEKANRGTFFLDEIGALSHSLQAKILQILEDKKMSRLGGVNDIPVDVRIIAATNSNLEEKILKGDFRTDLYYRLNVISIEVPPLRERKEDIPALTQHFMNKFCDGLRKDCIQIDDSVKEHFQKYDWPGNVREFENIMKGIIALQNTDIVYADLTLGNVADNEEEYLDAKSRNLFQIWDDSRINELINNRRDICLKTIRGHYIADVERQAICKALELTQWNRKSAAQLLRVSYKTLLNRIEEYNIV
ncbi:MAG: sigma-54-dependent Fis family transcriptional regulator [Deltaproteobacteria bacterium]|nr:sigma-54-dependent Fis family transcriptional regulator [Deltaproteobacteria bacterium]